MLERIGTLENIPEFLEGVKAGNERLMGFGHRVYKNYDPRARIIRRPRGRCSRCGQEPAARRRPRARERALEDEYFISRKLYPNVDFYSGLIYEALGLPARCSRDVRHRAHQRLDRAVAGDAFEDPEQKITRPRQIYDGPDEREYVSIGAR